MRASAPTSPEAVEYPARNTAGARPYKSSHREVAGFFVVRPIGEIMVTTRMQAERIQAKRQAAGKIGIAKAVRPFYKREGIGGA